MILQFVHFYHNPIRHGWYFIGLYTKPELLNIKNLRGQNVNQPKI